MKAKEYLLQQGRIESIGRGRISLDNHEFLAKSGLTFSDWPKGKVVKTEGDTSRPSKIRVVRDPAQSNEKVIAELYFRYDEHSWKAVANDGTVYGMREACNNCGCSLVGHTCDTPSVLGKPVQIVPRAG